MFPGYTTIYRDGFGRVHLYFFPGIDDDGEQIYRDIDLKSINAPFNYIKKSDNAMDIIFTQKITSVTCTLNKMRDNSRIVTTLAV